MKFIALLPRLQEYRDRLKKEGRHDDAVLVTQTISVLSGYQNTVKRQHSQLKEAGLLE